MNARAQKHGQKFQAGMSLVELMISVTLGLIVSAAMISLFISAKQNYRVNENLARLQENGRYAVSFISRDLRMADYRECVTQDMLDDAISGGENTITIQWQTNDDDCLTASSVVTTTTYTIDEGASGNPALFRSVDGGESEELVEDIDSLDVLYGEDTDDDNVPNYYVDADSVVDWAEVINVKFAVNVQTRDINIGSNFDVDDGRISRSFASAVTLRNRVP